ncbi:MAG: OmpA family protein [Rhodospirillales bacterium]|nr:OmpA family protein [Rhodospirillales bacterium]
MRSLDRRKLEGAPRWMVTFADLMALLFALFVLLLSFSKVDEESFRQSAGPMRGAFGDGDSIMQTTAIPGLRPGQSGAGRGQAQNQSRANQTSEIMEIARRQQSKQSFLFQFRRSLEREISDSRIVLIDEGNRIIIRFPGATTFLPGSDQFADEFQSSLRRIASIIKATQGQILISGHSDSSPISTARFRSNWDLSAARAVTVVHYLIQNAQVRSERVTAQGFGSSRPLVKNDTPENQSRNRRVEISIEISSFSG